MGSIIRPNDPTGYRGTSPQARYAQTPALASDQLSPRTFSTNGYSQSSESYTAIRRRYLAQLMGSRHRSVGPPSPPSSGSLASTFSSGSRMVRRPESFDSHHTHNNISGMYHRSAASTPGGINPRALSMASSPCPIFTNGDTSLAGSSHLSIAGAYHGPEEFQEGKEEEHPAYVSSIGAEITIAQPTPKQPVGVRQSGLPRGLTEADTEYGRGGSLTSERHWDSGRTVKVESVTPSVLDTDVEFERDSQGLAPSRKSEQRARKSCHREATSEDEASYFCKICDRGFARRYNYISHLSTHDQHRPRPWTCTRQDCSKSFRRATDLKRHEHSVSRSSTTSH